MRRLGFSCSYGESLSDLTKAKTMMEMTRHDGWPLFKGVLQRAMVNWTLNTTEKNPQVNYGVLQGLAMACDLAITQEHPDLTELEQAEKDAKTEVAAKQEKPDDEPELSATS
jgi:hypothetical protein